MSNLRLAFSMAAVTVQWCFAMPPVSDPPVSTLVATAVNSDRLVTNPLLAVGLPKATRKIGLDVVRVGAMSLVLLAHFNTNLTVAGIYGVEIFFGLSGFLIGDLLYQRLCIESGRSWSTIKSFWLRRWWRTWPNYFLFLLISLLIGFRNGGLPTKDILRQFLFFGQNFFSQQTEFYGVAWALCVEEWSYLFFPVAVLFLVSLGISNRTSLLISIIVFIVFPPIYREYLFDTTEAAFARIVTFGRLDAVFYGVATAFAVRRFGLKFSQKVFLSIIGLLVLVALGFFQNYTFRVESFTSFYRVALIALPLGFSLILPLVSCIERLPGGFSFLSAPITAVSLWSYSIYLSHLPIMFLTYDLFGEARSSALINLVSKFTGLAICLFLSFLIYRFFEAPLTRMRPSASASR